MPAYRKPRSLLATLAAAALAACGGDDKPQAADPVPPLAAPEIRGTAATGAALAGADVAISGADGSAACTQEAVVTDAAGEFRCSLKDGAAAPFLLVVTDPSGGAAPLVSVGLQRPAAGDSAVVNATPLTTAIVAQLAPDDNALALLADRGLLDAAALEAVTAKLLAQLAPMLSALGIPEGYHPFTTPLVAATPLVAGNAADRVLDVLRITAVNGQLQIAPFDQPESAVAIADAATEAPVAVAVPAAAPDDLAAGLRTLAQRLNACFARPLAQRVLAQDLSLPASAGGPEVTEAHADCGGVALDDFLNGGYRIGQQFHGLLTDAKMDGAVFQVPEVMLLLPADDDAHQAIVNLRYRDGDGTAGSVVMTLKRLTQDRPGVGAAGAWLMYGNQQLLQSSIQALVRQRVQLAPDAGSGSGPFGGAANSRYEVGLNVFVNKDGPGSTGLRAARIKGPGLPPAGLVLTPLNPAICSAQNWMNVRRKDGNTDPAAATPSGNVGNSFLLQRTTGLEGEDATTRRPNPFEGGTNNTQFINWAHPLDYGAQPGSTDYVDFAALRAMSVYRIEFYYEGETAPRHSYAKRLLTAVTPATRARSLQWVGLDAATRRYLDPADALAAAAPTIPLAWTANPLAETIASAGVYTGAAGVTVNQGQVAVVRGATGTSAPAPQAAGCAAGAASFPALDASGGSWRTFQLRYRVLDGSYKDSMTQYN